MDQALLLTIYQAQRAVWRARAQARTAGSPTQVQALNEAVDWLEFASRDGKDVDAAFGGKHPMADIAQKEGLSR
jgi:hypothetical protein